MKIFKNLLLSWIVMLCYSIAYSQNCDITQIKIESDSKLECIQGIYSPSKSDNSNYSIYTINHGFKFLTIILINNSFSEIIYGYVGFSDFLKEGKNKFGDIKIDSFQLCDLKQNGKFYVTILEKNVTSNQWANDILIQKEFSCEAGTIELFERQLAIYTKVSFLPYKIYDVIRTEQKKYNRNLLAEFRLRDILKKVYVKVDRSYFHNEPNERTKRRGFVISGDSLYVEEIKDKWIKVVYDGKSGAIEGWLKTSDVKFNLTD